MIDQTVIELDRVVEIVDLLKRIGKEYNEHVMLQCIRWAYNVDDEHGRKLISAAFKLKKDLGL